MNNRHYLKMDARLRRQACSILAVSNEKFIHEAMSVSDHLVCARESPYILAISISAYVGGNDQYELEIVI